MTEETIRELVYLTLHTVTLLTAPTIITIVIVGLLSNIIQTVVQIKDQSLTFVPKIIAVGIILALSTPWFIQTMENFTITIFNMISNSGS